VRAGAYWYNCTGGLAVTYPSPSTPQQGQYRSSSLVGSYQPYSSRPSAYQEWPQLGHASSRSSTGPGLNRQNSHQRRSVAVSGPLSVSGGVGGA